MRAFFPVSLFPTLRNNYIRARHSRLEINCLPSERTSVIGFVSRPVSQHSIIDDRKVVAVVGRESNSIFVNGNSTEWCLVVVEKIC
jgi:hypothetical protein